MRQPKNPPPLSAEELAFHLVKRAKVGERRTILVCGEPIEIEVLPAEFRAVGFREGCETQGHEVRVRMPTARIVRG
jgi:hypothetical protein